MEQYLNGSKALTGLAVAVALALLCSRLNDGDDASSRILVSEPRDYNPCCEFPCQNFGVCMKLENNSYYCDCTVTGHYGLNCNIPTWGESIKKMLKPSPQTSHHILTRYPMMWAIINRIPPLQKMIMKYIYLTRGNIIDSPALYESDHSYITLDAYYNQSYYGRTLPPVPEECPTPMGVKGPKTLLPSPELFRRVFLRRKFKPDPHNSNLLFQYYAQHFTHQFFRADYSTNGKMTKGSGGVDVSNIYGLTEDLRQALRAKIDGKMITQVINGEEFPPLVRDIEGIKMDYPPNAPIPEEAKFALGHPFFALLPGLFVYSTIWIREHNRVCDVLKAEHPDWDDERLYQTGRLIIIGQVIQITIEDYVQHLSQYNFDLTFDPSLVHGTTFQFHNRIHAEFDQLYHWHPLVPDGIQVNDTYYTIMDMAFSNSAVFKHGLDTFVQALVSNRAGAMTARNHPAVIEPIFTKAINNTRIMRFPPFNQYRKRFGMEPYKSFEEFTDDADLAKELKDIYGDIDAMEYYVGLVAENQGESVTGLTMVNIGGPWSVKGLISNPICSPKWWRPSTFGGDKGFRIVKEASIKKLFCNNMNKCSHISFSVPKGTP